MRDRLLEAVGIQTEPEHVDRAARRERWKRQAWLFASTALTAVVVGVPVSALAIWIDWHPRGAASAWPVFLFIGLYAVVDAKVFSWGVERFDLTIPWQFREERAKERDTR